jgi:hypothetical protein
MQTVIIIDKKMKDQIENLARLTGKPEEKVVAEALETGIKNYKIITSKSAQAALDLIEWAEKEQITGLKDLSTNHNKYAWDE